MATRRLAQLGRYLDSNYPDVDWHMSRSHIDGELFIAIEHEGTSDGAMVSVQGGRWLVTHMKGFNPAAMTEFSVRGAPIQTVAAHAIQRPS